MAAPARRHMVLLAAVRPTVSVALLVLLYYALPIDRGVTSSALLLVALGLVLVVVMVAWQLRRIVRSGFPIAQGVQALAVVTSLLILVFAATYYLLERNKPGSFNAGLSRTDALYFSVTVFDTVGFGDLVATTEPARIVVTVQMVADLLVVGGVLRLIVTAVQRAQSSRRAPSRHAPPDGTEPAAGPSGDADGTP